MDKETILIAMLIIMLYLLVFILVYGWLFRSEIIELRFKRILKTAIKHNTLKNIEDVYTLFKGINNSNKTDSDQRQDIGRILRKMIVDVHKRLDRKLKENKENEQIELLEKIKALSDENSKISPYSNLPLHERNVINDTLAFLKNGDNESAEVKLNELANFLISANEVKIKSAKDTKKSYILGILSVIITIVSLFF